MITTRQRDILMEVLREHVQTAQPVSSKYIAQQISCSPATIRLEFAELTDMGYISMPHTSGGRIPTKIAYRWWVDQLDLSNAIPDMCIDIDEECSLLPVDEQEQWITLRNHVTESGASNPETVAKWAARLISASAKQAAVSVCNGESYYYTGLSHLSAQPEYADISFAQHVARMMDDLERALTDFSRQSAELYDPMRTYIGSEYFDTDVCALHVLSFGSQHRFGLFGPVRQNYPLQCERMLRAREILSIL